MEGSSRWHKTHRGLPVVHYCHPCYGRAGYHWVEVQVTLKTVNPHQTVSVRSSEGKEVTGRILESVAGSLLFSSGLVTVQWKKAQAASTESKGEPSS